jgi:hypothetical protein
MSVIKNIISKCNSINRIHFLVLIFESVVILTFVGLLLFYYFHVYYGLKYIDNLNTENVYTNRYNFNEVTKYDKMYQNKEVEFINKTAKLYKFVNDNYKTNYFLYSYSLDIDSSDNYINYVATNKFFFKFYNINVISGSLNDLNNNNSNIIPIIIGNDLASKYKLNQIIKIEDPDDNVVKNYKVVGILPKNAKYPSFDFVGEYIYLNNSMIKLINVKDINPNSSSAFMIFYNLYVVANNKDELNKINVEAKKLNLAQLNFQTIKETVNEDLKYIQDGMLSSVLMIVVGSIIVIICSSIIYYFSFKKNIKKYIVKYYCGASFKDIRNEIFTIILIANLVGIIPSIIIFCVNKIGFLALLIELLYILLLAISISIVVTSILKRHSLIEIYRKEN